MSKKNNVKNFKNMVSNLDINKLYRLQEYVNTSTEFFKAFELYVVEYVCSDDEYSECYFTKNVINLYENMKCDLKIK